MGPGLWSDVGKRTRDLLYRDFVADQKFTLTTTTSTGLTFTSTGIKRGEIFNGEVVTQYKNKNVTVDVKVDTTSNIHSTITVDEFAKGTKAIFNVTIPDQKSGKAEFQYAHQYAGVTATVGMTSSPVVQLTTALGSNDFVIGGEVALDSATGSFTKYNAGIGLNKPDISAALILGDMGDTIKASYSHTVNPYARTMVGAEIAHKLSKNENTFAIGGMYGLDPLTTLKAKINNQGTLAATIQHEWRPKSLVTLSGEVDTKALNRNAKLGFALALKP